MNRKDIIIISVLVNAGLLIILFASAIKSPTRAEIVQVQKQEVEPVSSSLIETPPLQIAPQDFPTMASSSPVSPSTPPVVTVTPLPELPAPGPIAHEEPEESFMEIKVQKGDALDKIARHHRISVAKIMEFNHLSSTNLRIGQTLKIPRTPKSASLHLDLSSPGAKYYTVKPGDSPWSIAMKNHLNLEELLKLNHLDAEKARRLKPGDQLRVQ